MISGTQGSGSAMWGQLQMQQAQRTADQAEQRARALQDSAQAAQREADQAQGNARNLKIDSNQARGEADTARRNVAVQRSASEVSSQFGELREQIATVLSSPTLQPTASPSSTTSFTNAQGQATGTLINVTA
jgi:hypothetical protein